MEFFLLTDGGKSLQTVAASEKLDAECTAMAFSPDGTYLITGDANRYLRLFKVSLFKSNLFSQMLSICLAITIEIAIRALIR